MLQDIVSNIPNYPKPALPVLALFVQASYGRVQSDGFLDLVAAKDGNETYSHKSKAEGPDVILTRRCAVCSELSDKRALRRCAASRCNTSGFSRWRLLRAVSFARLSSSDNFGLGMSGSMSVL